MYMLAAALGGKKFRSSARTQYGNKSERKREVGAGVGAWVAGRTVLCDRQTWSPGLAHLGKHWYLKSVSLFLSVDALRILFWKRAITHGEGEEASTAFE